MTDTKTIEWVEERVKEYSESPFFEFKDYKENKSETYGAIMYHKGLDWLRSTILSAVEVGRKEEAVKKDGAYHERDMVVCALSKLFPSYLARHPDEDKEWEDDWRWIVYIELPTGQVSWHIHDSERDMFNHLDVRENNWDGHNTERKYERLNALEKFAARNPKTQNTAGTPGIGGDKQTGAPKGI